MLDTERVKTAVTWTERGTWWACTLPSSQQLHQGRSLTRSSLAPLEEWAGNRKEIIVDKVLIFFKQGHWTIPLILSLKMIKWEVIVEIAKLLEVTVSAVTAAREGWWCACTLGSFMFDIPQLIKLVFHKLMILANLSSLLGLYVYIGLKSSQTFFNW